VQGLVLRRSLSQGLPDPLVYGYASFMCLNGLSVAVTIITAKKHTAFAEVLIDSLYAHVLFLSPTSTAGEA
jgi:hypothetical protein